MKRKSVIVIASIIAVTAIAFFGIRNQMKKKATNDDNTIKVGALLPLTGSIASIGKEFQDALLLAAHEKVNQCSVDIYDTKGEAKTGVLAFQSMLSKHKPSIVFSAVSSVALSVREQIEKKCIPHFSMVGAAGLITPQGKFTYRCLPSATVVANTIAEWIKEKNFSKTSILHTNDELGNSFSDALKLACAQREIPIYKIYDCNMNRAEYQSIATKIAKEDTDCLYVASIGDNLAEIIKVLRVHGYKKTIICDMNLTPNLVYKCGDAILNVFIADYCTPHNDEYNSFVTRFKSKYGYKPNTPALLSYETFRIYFAAIEKFGQNAWIQGNKVNNFTFNGMLGKITVKNHELWFPLEVRKATKNNAKTMY